MPIKNCAPLKIFCTVHVHASCASYHTLQTHTHTIFMESYNCMPQYLASSHLLPPHMTTPTCWLYSLVRSPSPHSLEVLGVVVSSVYVVLHTIYGKQTILINHHTIDYSRGRDKGYISSLQNGEKTHRLN